MSTYTAVATPHGHLVVGLPEGFSQTAYQNGWHVLTVADGNTARRIADRLSAVSFSRIMAATNEHTCDPTLLKAHGQTIDQELRQAFTLTALEADGTATGRLAVAIELHADADRISALVDNAHSPLHKTRALRTRTELLGRTSDSLLVQCTCGCVHVDSDVALSNETVEHRSDDEPLWPGTARFEPPGGCWGADYDGSGLCMCHLPSEHERLTQPSSVDAG